MYSQKGSFVSLAIFGGLMIITSILRADYYKPDFFPIGLTGLNYTGSGTPYGNVEEPWSWDVGTKTEKALIEALGVNCIVFEEDGFLGYMGSLDSTVCRNQNNYLYRVCIPSSTDDGDSVNANHIYIIILTGITDSLDF